MADSATNLDLVAVGQGQKETTVNAVLNAGSTATYFGLRKTVGLTWHYYGGIVDPLAARIPNGSLSLTASSTCYIEHTTAGAVSFNTVAFTAGRVPDYIAVTDTDEVSSYQDVRTAGGSGSTLTDAMVFKGVINASANPNYPAADAGHVYKISVAGKIGGASGVNVEVGDTIYCITDGSAAGTQAAVGANWVVQQVNIDGQVVGPASATNNNLAVFDGTTGKLIKDGGPVPAGGGGSSLVYALIFGG